MKRNIGLLIIGDEILSGRREDKHLNKIIQILKERNLTLSWAKVLPDDINVLIETFKKTLANNDIIFSCGGIGATPDDKTREAIAKALGVDLELNSQAATLITARFAELAKEGRGTLSPGSPENQRRLAMGVFPVGAQIVPNPYNKIPGFFIKDHTFVPGFPEMAWPMIEWTLDHRYHNLARDESKVLGTIVYHLPESRITNALEIIEDRWESVSTFSLPTVARDGQPPFIDLGVKGPKPDVEEAFEFLKGEILRVGGRFQA